MVSYMRVFWKCILETMKPKSFSGLNIQIGMGACNPKFRFSLLAPIKVRVNEILTVKVESESTRI